MTSTLLTWLKIAACPEPKEMDGSSRELSYYWARFDELSIVDGILGIRNPVENQSATQFCAIVPQASKQEILELANGSPAGGHFGVQKTIYKLKQRFFGIRWFAMYKTCVTNVLRAIDTKSPSKTVHQCSLFTQVNRSKESMDIICPLPRTTRGNRYILTVVDHFSKHAEAYPIADKEAVTVARAFLNEFVSRYGIPYTIHTD